MSLSAMTGPRPVLPFHRASFRSATNWLAAVQPKIDSIGSFSIGERELPTRKRYSASADRRRLPARDGSLTTPKPTKGSLRVWATPAARRESRVAHGPCLAALLSVLSRPLRNCSLDAQTHARGRDVLRLDASHSIRDPITQGVQCNNRIR
jgi:hypothetical protein